MVLRPVGCALALLLCCSWTSFAQSETDWLPGLQATHYWDCNGQGCDASVLQPFDKSKFVSAPQYAPTDPAEFGGPKHGEKMWLTGAASDTLAQQLGRSDGCCGADADSPGCGRCLLVRNPSALNPDWTAVVMKKNRCPPQSMGCEAGKVHIDIAAPGYDNFTASTANICGKSGFETYFVNQDQSGACAGVHHGCTCDSLPDDTAEQQFLKKGCILFGTWGWTRGDPVLEYKPVDCPEAWEKRVGGAFGGSGVRSLTRRPLWPWVLAITVAAVLALAACVVNRILDNRREAKEAAKRERKRHKREKERRRLQGGEVSSDSSSSSSSDDEGTC